MRRRASARALPIVRLAVAGWRLQAPGADRLASKSAHMLPSDKTKPPARASVRVPAPWDENAEVTPLFD